jgi:hypothetical protein
MSPKSIHSILILPFKQFVIFSIVRFVYALIDLIAFAVGVSETTLSQTYVYILGATLIAANIFYVINHLSIVVSFLILYDQFIVTYMAYVMYNEFRAIAANYVNNPPADPYGRPPAPYGAADNFPAPGNADYEAPRPAAPSTSSNSGFKAFSGKGYRLGD